LFIHVLEASVQGSTIIAASSPSPVTITIGTCPTLVQALHNASTLQIEDRLDHIDELDDEDKIEGESEEIDEDKSEGESEEIDVQHVNIDEDNCVDHETANSSEDNEDDTSSSDQEDSESSETSDAEDEFDDDILSSHAKVTQTQAQKKRCRDKWKAKVDNALTSGSKYDKSYVKREFKRIKNEKQRPTLDGTRWTANSEIRYPPKSDVDIASQKFKDGM